MSSFQSWLQRLRDGQLDLAQLREEVQRGNWLNRSLWLGLGLGLILGLIVGWGLWPVQWTAASLADLRPAARADYMAAVADAYALSSTPEAAAIAQQRLSALGSDNLPQLFAAAITYYRDSPAADKAARIDNLNRLASALGLAAPGAGSNASVASGVITQTTGAGQAAAPGNDSAASSANATVNSTASSWLTWLLWLLIALMVIAGAFYLYLMIRPARPRYQPATYDEELDDDMINARFDEMGDAPLHRRTQMYGDQAADAEPVSRNQVTRPESSSGYGSTARSAMRSSAPTLYQRPQDEYAFDEEELDEAPAGQRFTLDKATMGAQSWAPYDEERPDESEPEEADELDDEADQTNGAPHSAPNTTTANLNEMAPPAVGPTTGPRANSGARSSRGKLLEKYMAHYQAGISNYEEKHPILDARSNKYIGEIGMGISTKNALFQNDPTQAIALEVWLFDKADERNLGSPTRILLSEYAVDHNLEQAFLKGRQDDPRPFTAQPNVRFQLEGHNLLLDCEITEALYVKSGPNRGVFQSVKVEMAVLQKV